MARTPRLAPTTAAVFKPCAGSTDGGGGPDDEMSGEAVEFWDEAVDSAEEGLGDSVDEDDDDDDDDEVTESDATEV